ncbi:hypothetical protein P7C71_g1030, partial [Lecanoromycetidae sp. Uapishka_2]
MATKLSIAKPLRTGGKLHAPVVNPTDKYQEKAASLHTYGQYLLSCMPKFIQQFSVWKDELTIYIPPSGVIPVISFLKYHTAAEYTMVADITAVDYPTRYDEEKKRIVVEPLELTQAFRNFEGGTAAWEQVGPGKDRKPSEFQLPTPKPEPPKEEEKKK